MKTFALLLVLVCIVGLVKSWEWPWQTQKKPWERPQFPIPNPNPRDKWCRLNLGPAWGGRC
ncbi:accessory gland-specific peptide 70A [Drosophila takahashii]|uniref:accessory gland-specific peptide 70A n=1 Tax=Drosophila takahashii TaxID=29030 RepID=UPI0007E838B9|nr:accessory gland-specific peptide 70A [Drosophila takahashii]